MKKDRRDDRLPLFNPKLALDDVRDGPTDHFWALLGWAVGCLMVSWLIFMGYRWLPNHLDPTVARGLAINEVACLLTAGTFVIWAIPSLVVLLRTPNWTERTVKLGQHWVIATACLSTATGALWAASQHAANGCHLLSGILIFFAMTLVFLFKKGDSYVSLIQLAVILGPQAAFVVALLGT